MKKSLQITLSTLSDPTAKHLEVIQVLRQNGFVGWLAGGCVRDALLQREPKDVDIVTNASVGEISKLFKKTLQVGASFGVVRVLLEAAEFEVAQFRKEADYRDGRRPSLVEPGTPEQDAWRRDLTVNALFYDPISRTLFDEVGGLEDLQKKSLRAVGDPDVRLQEDHLRILRAIRFKAQLGFDWDESLERSMRKNVAWVAKVSRERIRDELLKMSLAPYWDKVRAFMLEAHVAGQLFPLLQFQNQRYPDIDSADEMRCWWSWALWGYRSGSSANAILAAMRELKLSSKELTSVENFLYWWSEPWQTLRLGATLATSFKPGAREGLLTWLKEQASGQQELRQLLQKYGAESPKAWIVAADLPEFKGPELGEQLREFYYRQLEGLDLTREEALERLAQLRKR